MCDCFHLAFPNWHAASSGTGAGRRLRAPEPNTEDDSICDEPSQFTEGERPRPQGSSPVEEFPETGKYTDSDKECEAEHDPHHKSGSGKKSKKSGLGSMFEKRSTPKMSKLKEVHSPESGVIVKTAKDGCAEGLVYGGGGKDGIFIKEVVPESPASKSLKLKEGDQILSATVYFDNVSYEDAIQILEHAQAYKVKLCLKRKPDITETEAAIESDVIPEDDLYAPEMREKGKTKRRGDARISWPKFPSFGKGRKSRFTRSHSSSEADEQRKLELSPTTSDTESPIKSQDAVKDKKKHKLKLSMLTKRGRISSTEDQDTDTPTTGQISGKILQTHDTSDMLSHEFLESPSGETPKVYVKEDQKVVEVTEPQTQHKVELITLDNTLKTEDLTVALADKESSPGIKSPDGKKKKKERSELKMKILGKDKHKKDTKAKSPKRLKTLGASIEIPDQPDNEKSDVIPSSESHTKQGDQLALDANSQIISNEGSKVISAKSVTTQMEISVPKVELDISDVALIRKSPQKGEEKMTKGKDIKQKEETKISATFKLPKTDFGDITTEETVQKVNVKAEESTTKFEQLPTEGTKVKEDPYEQLSKRSLSRTQLPKREEIEIPGMEDMSMRITAKGIKEPKTGFTGRYEEIKAETSPMSIDVDSVKEAVSKLPGFKLPKVDTSGVPIPEEIIVIDANAQRISVKTPTKVVDTKTKHEAHFTKYDITASPEISKTTVKLPKITPADITSEELLIETKVDLKTTEKKHKSKAKQSDKDIKTEDYKREDIIIPGKESAQEGAIHQAQDTVNIQSTAGIKFEYDSAVTLSPRESDKKTKKARITMPSFGIARQDIKIPDVGMDFPEQNISLQKDDTLKGERTIFLQDVKMSKMESRKGKAETGELISDAKTAETDEFEYIDSVSGSDIKYVEAEDQTNKLLKFGAVTAEMNLNVPDVEKDVNIDGAEIKTFEGEGKGSKFKMPNLAISMPRVKGPKIDLSLSKKDVDVTLPQAKAEVKLQEVPEVDVTIGHVDVSIPEQRFEVEKPEVEIQPLMTEVERDGQGGKFRMPKLGITMPKVKGPDVDLSFSKKAGDVPEAKANIKIPEQPESEAEMDVQGSRFKMPKFGISMPKVKGPEIDFSLSKKDVDMSLPEAKAEVKLPDVEDVHIKAPNVDIEGPSLDVKTTAVELDGKGSKFKMPKFGISLPKVKGSEIDLSLSKKDVDVTLPKAKAEVKLPDFEGTEPGVKVEVKAPEIAIHQQDVAEVKLPEAPKVDVSIGKADVSLPEKKLEVTKPELEIKPLQSEVELDGQGGKFKMPKLGMSMPKVKGPEIHFGMSKKDRDVTLPEAKAEVKVPEVELKEPSSKVEIKAPEIKVAAKGIEGSPSKFKMPTFKLPKFGVGTPNISVNLPDMDKDVKTGEADINIPEEECLLNIEAPSTDIECPSIDMKTTGTEQDGKGSKFKMPHLGFSMPKVKGPKIDVSLSKKDTDVTLPEAKADVKLPEVDLGKVDVSIPDAKIEVPESKAEIQLPEAPKIAAEMKPLESEAEMDGHGGRFKLPKFGVKMPKVKGPEFDLSLSKKDVDVKLPETKAEPKIDVSLGKAEVLIPEAKAEIKKPEVQIKPLQTDIELDGHGGKFKMPKFGITMPKGPGIDLGFSKKDVDVTLPEAKAEVILPDAPKMSMHMTPPECEAEIDGQGSKFKMPKFGISMPKVKGPEIDLSLSKKDVDVTLPEAKAEVELPEAPKIAMDIKPPVCETEIDGQGSKFKMPQFGITMPKVKGPEIDLSFSKKDMDVTLPEAKAEVKLPDVELKEPSVKVEINAPETEAQLGQKGSPSKFKMPTFKFPKFGVSTPQVSVEAPDVDKEIKIDGADMKISVPHTDIDVPEVKAQVHLPELEVKEPSGGVVVDLQPDVEVDTKVKKPKFSMPRFSFSKPSIKSPEVDVSLPDVDAAIPEGKVEVKGGEVDVNLPECEAEIDGQGRKFKMPKFGITMPKITGPDIDLSLSKKDVDVTLPEAKAEVKLPDVELKEPSAEVEIKAPDIKVGTKDKDGSPSKFKMPTFKLPKFGIGSPSATMEVPDVDKDVKIDGADMKIPEEVLRVEIAAPSIDTEGPSIDIKTTGTEYEGKGSKFKMPSLGFSVPQVKGPNIDLSLSKKDVDVTLPEARVEAQLPDVELKESSAKMEIKAPGIDVETSNIEGSPSKFKMPTFKLPKFGAATPQVSVEGPDVDIEVDGADLKLPKTKAEVKLPDVEIKEPVAAISVQPAPVTEGDAKLKKPRFSLPKFSFSKQSTKEPGVDVSLPDVDVSLPEGKVEVKQPEVELKSPEVVVELDGQGSKFKMPKFGISMPKVKGPEIDLSLSKKDVDVTLPEAKAEVQIPDVKSSAKVEIKGPEIKAQAGTLEGSPSKLKMPTFTLPKFGASTPKVSVEVPDVDKDINIDGTKGVKVDVTAPSIDTEGLSVDVKAKGSEGSESKFKMPNLAISMPKVKGPEADLSLSKKDVDITLPEAKAEVQLPDVQVKEPEGAISVPDAPTVEVEAKLKRSNWTFPKFSFSKTGGKAPDVDVNLETPKVDVTSPEVKAEVCLPDVEVQGPSVAISMEEPPAAELDANLKKAKFSLPKFSFSKSSMKEPDVSADLPHVDVSLPEGEVIVKQPEIEVKAPKLEAEHDEQGNKFKLPKFGITLPKVKGAEGDLSPSQKDVDITLPEVKAEVKLPEIEVKSSADVEIKASETEAKLKDVGGSPLKFKMPTMKLPKFGGATYDVTVQAPDADKLVETDGTKLKEDVNVINIKSPIVDIKTDVSKAAITDADTPKTETEGLGSPSKFKLPSFKMPRLSFSKTKPEGEYVPVETECKEDELEMEVELKGESKSQKTSLTSFGEILKTIDVEFDVPKTDENLETSKIVKETDEPSGKQLEPKEKQTNIKQDTTKSPERTGWFKFPKFGLSSPSEPAKSSEKDEKSPVGERLDEELSPTCSVQSSDAFADISSAMTSEHVGLSLSSPTKVTVKYSDPNTASGLGEMHSNIITSTTRTELISVEPNLPEKITILSSGVSSSSEDTLRLESGKIHVITSNIQATPEAQHAKLLTAIQIQSAEGPLLKSEANEASSWTVEESHSGKRTIFERHSVRETTSEISESKETIVITKQITRMFDSSEPISGETASSIQRLRDSVHSDKMRFFDGAEK